MALGAAVSSARAANPIDARSVVPSPVLAMAVFLFTEVMLFCGLVSAYLVLRGHAVAWPPLDQPRLPVAVTAVNTIVLLWSGRAMAQRRMERALALGALFVAVQGYEWTRLLAHGLTMASSVYGGCFYTIVGLHALHVLAALAVLAWARRPGRSEETLQAVRLYWYFVVGIWPVLYTLVYLW